MNLQDKINDWNRQIEQAQQYSLYFDLETVKGMIEIIGELAEENSSLRYTIKKLTR